MDDSCELKVENEDTRDQLRTVIILRGDKGYGLTVSGESPVIVQDVKEGGPAALSGVKKGDSIIKVNDTLVSKVNHTDVVSIIKSSRRVKLTLKSGDDTGQGSTELSHKSFSSSSSSNAKLNDLITPPLPVNTHVQNKLEENRVKMLHKFLEKQQNLKESVILELNKAQSKNIQRNLEKELESVNRQIQKFMEELKNVREIDNQSNSSGSDSSSRPSTHNLVKSSPDPLSGLQNSPEVSNRHSGCESFGSESSFWGKSVSVVDGETRPPGTPPPPYLNSGLLPLTSEEGADEPLCTILDETSSSSILTMEEEDGDILEQDHGPFMSLNKLMKHNAYLAVFVNYVISNCDPSSLFFYMITDLYREGGAKERKKWAYEIHSSFLLPGAPMRLSNIDESVLYEIDETLHKDLDKEEILKKLFWKARHRSKEDLNEQLADFRSKRNAGLGSLFGPADIILEETINNKTKEMAVVEHLLIPSLESISEDLRNQSDQMIVMASSLSTILFKYFNIRTPHALSVIDRCPLFVNKDRPLKSKLLKGSKKQVVRDHSFILTTYYSVSYCNHCGIVIWGVAPQGYQCSNCEMNIHKACVKHVEETCVGQVHKNEKGKDTKLVSFLSKIIPDEKDRMSRKSSQINPGHIDKARLCLEADALGSFPEDEALSGDKGMGSSSGPSSKEQRRSDPGVGPGSYCPGSSSLGAASNSQSSNNGATLDEDSQAHLEESEASLRDSIFSSSGVSFSTTDSALSNLSKSQNGGHKKKSSSNINRSESCKEKHHARKQTRETRKNSDPNIPTSKSGDVEGDSTALTSFHSGSSSNSSLSQSQESPPGNASEQVQAYDSALDNDSDVEVEADLPDWTQRLTPEEVEHLSSKERKRQETINEFFHTEQSHVRTLKVLTYLFHQPLRHNNMLSPDLLDLLFPNLDQILKFHSSFNKAMKRRRQEAPLVSHVGDILSSMFEGEDGMQFQQAAAEFIASQSFALENLKQHQKRDSKLANFLQDQENLPHCRRLQLKDMLPAGFQRLSKYPLLCESLLSYTDRSKQAEEYEQISKALDRTKEILAYVNVSVQQAENQRRLQDIQKRLDQSSLIKNKHGKEEPKVELDLTKHNLIHEGPLTLKTRGQKSIELHVLLLEEGVVLLQKDNDKYVLRYHSISKSIGKDGKDDNKLNHFPIIKFGTFLFRPVATDVRAFFLVLTQTQISAQIYELVAMSPSEARMWLKHLQDAQTAYDIRGGRRSHAPPHIPNSEDSPPSSEPIKDSQDIQEGEGVADPVDLMSNLSLQDQQNEVATNPQSSPSPETLVSKKTELLRRKDLKIREELQIKQDLIADILNIPRQHFESVADMAGEMGLSNKEPRELVLGSIYQAKKLQEALNEAQTLRECDIMASQASTDSSKSAAHLPLYPAPMEKLLNISANLTQLLNALLSLVSERDDERDRMRKELVASRERLHQLHMQQNTSTLSSQATDAPLGSQTPGGKAHTSAPTFPSSADVVSPHSSRPASFVSVSSSSADPADQPQLEEDIGGEEPRPIPFNQNMMNPQGSLSKFSDTSDCDTGLSQTSISEESEVVSVSTPAVDPSSTVTTEDTPMSTS